MCSCLPNYVGRPPSCRPECTIHAECPSNKACQRERCRDPCPGSCGAYADCRVVNHAPQCFCQAGFTGDPFSGCHAIPIALRTCFPSFQGGGVVTRTKDLIPAVIGHDGAGLIIVLTMRHQQLEKLTLLIGFNRLTLRNGITTSHGLII